jgi:hypothetical protein
MYYVLSNVKLKTNFRMLIINVSIDLVKSTGGGPPYNYVVVFVRMEDLLAILSSSSSAWQTSRRPRRGPFGVLVAACLRSADL